MTRNASYNPDAANVGRLFAWLFGLAPALLFVLTWSDDPGILQIWMRAYAFPIVAIQLAIVFISLREGVRLPKPRPLPLALLAALGLVAWGTAVTAPSPALIRTGIWTVQLAFALAVVNLWHHRMLDLDQHIRAILVGFLVVFALLVAFIATTEQSDIERVFGLPAFSHVRWFGEYAAAAIGLCALGFLRRDRLSLLVAIFAFAMAFWTGTRGTVVAAAAGLLLCTILFREFRSIRAWCLFLLSGLAGFVLAFGLDAFVPIGQQGPDSMARFGWTGRIEIWQAAIGEVLERPLFGHGDGRFRYAIGEGMLGQPHNVVLQVLHAWGFVGGLLCLTLVIWLAPRFLRTRQLAAAPFQYAALTIAIHSLVEGALYHVQPLSLFVLCCAVAVAIGQNGAAEVRSPPPD